MPRTRPQWQQHLVDLFQSIQGSRRQGRRLRPRQRCGDSALEPARREQLEQFLGSLGGVDLVRWAARLDPEYKGGGRQRATRAVEVALLSGHSLSWWQQEARGEALLATGKRDQARDTYLKALTAMDVAAPQRRLVELKLSDLGGTPPKPAQPTS